ncbi:MAG: N-acetyltransferase [Prevotella sp.]|nr:N-acetyltransferase [Prevotella sp.]
MKEIQIIRATSKKERKLFAEYGNRLYAQCPYAVPELAFDILDTFDAKKNAAYEFCEAQLFLAVRGSEIVGRVAAIINHRANETWDVKNVRFGYLDFINDASVADALLHAVEEWGRERGMTSCQGPMGFTDFDKEGMLIEGFDRLGSITTYYNHPYYPEHMERMDYEKEIDWVQLRVAVPAQTPDRFLRVGELVQKRFGLTFRKLTRKLIEKEDYGRKIFHLLNEAYSPLFGYSKLSDKQIDSFVKTYLNLVNLRFVTIIHDPDGQLVGVGVTMGSLSRAMQKAKGRLLPFGWYHIIKAMRYKFDDTVEMLLIAVKPEYQGKGVNALLFCDLIPTYNEAGFKWAETAPQLENNMKELNQWDVLNPEYTKRRRCYRKKL